MGKRNGIEKENSQRKKGLKNPTKLWTLCFLLTFALTVLSASFAGTLESKKPLDLFNWEYWVTVIMDNLHPMIITQSVVTMLQNFSIAHLSKEERKSPQFVPCITWTYALVVFLIIYIFLYLAIVYAAPLWRNAALSGISGSLVVIGFASVLQLDREQERIRAAVEGEKLEAEKSRGDGSFGTNGQTFGWNGPPPDPPFGDIPSAGDGGECCSGNCAPTVK